jgi:hypothetical protein
MKRSDMQYHSKYFGKIYKIDGQELQRLIKATELKKVVIITFSSLYVKIDFF